MSWNENVCSVRNLILERVHVNMCLKIPAECILSSYLFHMLTVNKIWSCLIFFNGPQWDSYYIRFETVPVAIKFTGILFGFILNGFF